MCRSRMDDADTKPCGTKVVNPESETNVIRRFIRLRPGCLAWWLREIVVIGWRDPKLRAQRARLCKKSGLRLVQPL
jgi:hypothetical protein